MIFIIVSSGCTLASERSLSFADFFSNHLSSQALKLYSKEQIIKVIVQKCKRLLEINYGNRGRDLIYHVPDSMRHTYFF